MDDDYIEMMALLLTVPGVSEHLEECQKDNAYPYDSKTTSDITYI